MRRLQLAMVLVVCMAISLNAQPYMVTATNYAAGFFGVVADENGQPLETESVIHLVWDSAGDGMDEPDNNGMPIDDDVLIGTCQVGITGGAPSDGTFILPGTAPDGGGWCYLRAFHAVTPEPGTYYSESITQYSLPEMADPVLYGIQFPDVMTQSLGDTQALTVTLTPVDPPIVLPASGGSFDYQVEIVNNMQDPVDYDVWVDLILPNGTLYGPLISRTDLTMPVGGTLSRQMTQSVPGGAPEGVYMYVVHTGDFVTSTIIHEDSFPFEKDGAVGSDGLLSGMQGWMTDGWDGGEFVAVAVPDVYFLAPPFPNPFNPSTSLQFGLPEAANVRIDVYNILGSRVTTLIDQTLNAGYHSVVWSAPNIASGLYLVQMKAGGYVHTNKAFLLK